MEAYWQQGAGEEELPRRRRAAARLGREASRAPLPEHMGWVELPVALETSVPGVYAEDVAQHHRPHLRS